MTHERTDEHDPEAEVRLGLQDALDPAHYERALDEIMARLAHAEHDLQGHDECSCPYDPQWAVQPKDDH